MPACTRDCHFLSLLQEETLCACLGPYLEQKRGNLLVTLPPPPNSDVAVPLIAMQTENVSLQEASILALSTYNVPNLCSYLHTDYRKRGQTMACFSAHHVPYAYERHILSRECF